MTDIPRSHHLIDPELLPQLEMIPNFDLNPDFLAMARMALGQAPAPENLPITPVRKVIEGPDGPIEIYWFDPAPGATNRPALLHVHGGGMVIGSARLMADGPSALAASTGIPVASVEYRLAPDTPFPGPQEDCYAALRWLVGAAGELGIDPARIGVTGESAGGGLAAAVALMARDRGDVRIAAQILVYPMIDHRVGGADDPWRNRHTGEFIWTRGSNQFGWESLRGGYGVDDERKGWFSPSRADDLAGLPPTWIGVGTLDLFFDEDLDYARRLVDAGVPVELHVYPGAFHGFDRAAEARVTKDFRRDLHAGTRRLLGVA